MAGRILHGDYEILHGREKTFPGIAGCLGVAIEVQKMNVDRLRPGADPKDLWNMTNDFLKKKDTLLTATLCHGQGLPLLSGR